MNAIDERKSSRSFMDKPLTAEDTAAIQTFLTDPENTTGPYGTPFRFELQINSSMEKSEKIGTYGIVNNCQAFIIGVGNTTDTSLFEYGYVLEKIVLFLTEQNIGNCILGGTFTRQKASSTLNLSDGEFIPAICAIGYSHETPRLKEKLQRKVIKADLRKDEDILFFEGDFETPLHHHAPEYEQALHNVQWAPSSKNRQPWRLLFTEDHSAVHFYFAAPRKALDNGAFGCDPEFIDLGIAFNHFEQGLDDSVQGVLAVEESPVQTDENLHYVATWKKA